MSAFSSFFLSVSPTIFLFQNIELSSFLPYTLPLYRVLFVKIFSFSMTNKQQNMNKKNKKCSCSILFIENKECRNTCFEGLLAAIVMIFASDLIIIAIVSCYVWAFLVNSRAKGVSLKASRLICNTSKSRNSGTKQVVKNEFHIEI